MPFNLTLFWFRRIECERLTLRPIELSDAADMFEYASDEENTRYVFEQHKNLEETKDAIATFFMANPAGKYAIELKETKKMIGTIDIRVVEEHKHAEIGYVLNKRYWGKGYMTEAATALLQLAFESMKLEKVYACHDADNVSSGKVMIRLGMQREGILRQHRIHKGKRIDTVYYGILRDEYYRNLLEK
ncbi:GNAT family N-acetyltransferase [Jeotgalibaca caeni]|uniref:GNAT family N-acetyltransferase n=1 Tax=Jeotgalibaca caeni TaxID=3028623 RepID=UPI00237EB69F|nr:GNAT family protein [Jeotgalibaca caeni]MDE1548827.1 GNAT family protein [Jeotgalibaca caeni]